MNFAAENKALLLFEMGALELDLRSQVVKGLDALPHPYHQIQNQIPVLVPEVDR